MPTLAAAQVGLPINPADLERLLRSGAKGSSGESFSPQAEANDREPADSGRNGMRGGSKRATNIAPLAALEQDFSMRANEILRLFGYDALKRRSAQKSPTTGAIYDSYQLGVGDEIIITLQGQRWRNIHARINSSGQVILPQLPPLPAAGRTLGEFRASLRSDVKRTMLDTEVFVSIGQLRTVDVAVLGEVAFPGIYHLTGLSNLIDALIQANGVKKSGSLRQVRFIRGGQIRTVDLYDLLIGGGIQRDLTLREGDRIVVPTIGPTVGIGGHVKRPGIYELSANGSPMMRKVLEYAGSTVRPRGNRFIHISMGEDGRELIRGHKRIANARVKDGDIVIVQPGGNVQIGGVNLEGEVRVPGSRALSTARTARQLIPDIRTLGKNAYLPFAVVRRLDLNTHTPTYLAINLLDVLANRSDIALRSSDSLIVFHRKDIEFLRSADVQAVLSRVVPPSAILVKPHRPAAPPNLLAPSPVPRGNANPRAGPDQTLNSGNFAARFPGLSNNAAPQLAGSLPPRAPKSNGGPDKNSTRQNQRWNDGLVRKEIDETLIQTDYACAGLRTLSALMTNGGSDRFGSARQASVNRRTSQVLNIVSCPRLYDRYPDLLAFVLDYVAAVDGEVLAPGIYPVASEITVGTLARVAGGLTREADLSNVEISRVALSGAKGASAFHRSIHNLARKTGKGSLADAIVGPGDSVRISRIFTAREDGPVLLTGEFRHPGLYRIRRGERLSQIFARAGGLTDQAYPFGAVFLRKSAQRAQKQAFERTAEQLQLALAAQATKAEAAVIAAGDALIKRMLDAEPLGRVVIEADPTVLEVRPESDILVEPGDQLIIPKRPTTVHVSGAVLNPGSMRFESVLGAREYIGLAGGYADIADEGRTFVILPNGKAKRLSVSFWNYSPINIPPGSTIVVPRDPTPFELGAFVREAADLISKVALTAASLAVIGR